MTGPFRTWLQATVNRFPGLRPVLLATWALVLRPVVRIAFMPFRVDQGRGDAAEDPELVGMTTVYNEAAERYFAEYADPQFLLAKPFSEPRLFPSYLVSAGTLLVGSRLRPGDTVVDFGAGSCWLSHLLNRYGCRTISIDVSESALALGRQVFERDPRTNWSLDPLFLAYDGHTLPLDDASCDRILVFDAFHHVPNQREILAEMHRVLTVDGIVAMHEPGRGHSTSPSSEAESQATGVLENELIIEDLAALAEAVGFRTTNVIAAGMTMPYEIPARQIGRFIAGSGQGFYEYWSQLRKDLVSRHYVLLYKGESQPTTSRPDFLTTAIAILRPTGHVRCRRGESIAVRLRLFNHGNTRWLHTGVGALRTGWTRIGVHLYGTGEVPRLIDFDWHRHGLDRDVEPASGIVAKLDLPAIPGTGDYELHFDLVIEGLTWFAEQGASAPALLRATVE